MAMVLLIYRLRIIYPKQVNGAGVINSLAVVYQARSYWTNLFILLLPVVQIRKRYTSYHSTLNREL